MENVFYAIFAAFIAYFVYKLVTKGGLMGAIFGSKVLATVGEIPVDTETSGTHVIRVHKLESGQIGIEWTSKAMFGFSINGFTVSPEQSSKLIALIQNAK